MQALDPVRIFDKWALGVCRSPSETLLVSGMNGEIVELDLGLTEQRRWQAHDGAVNCMRVIGGSLWTTGGDACVKRWDFDNLEPEAQYSGPKKAVTSVMLDGDFVVSQSYERAVHLWPVNDPAAKPRTIKKVASLVRLEDGSYWACPLTGSKAGDIGALCRFDLENGVGNELGHELGGQWSMQAIAGEGVLAFGLDLKARMIDPTTFAVRELPWHSKQGAPNLQRLSDGRLLLFGDGTIYLDDQAFDAPVKGIYSVVELDGGRLVFSGADGQLWPFQL